MKLKSPTGLVLLGLGKPSSNVPFMMPKRVADTDPNTQISDFTGSGPFIFKRDEWKPGDKTVYVKNANYKPRSEPASGLAGGKVVKVDRVEWRAISDHQQAVNALLAGEIDFIEAPPHDLLPLGLGDANVTYVDWNPWGNQYTFRPNWTAKPFDNPKVRQALMYAFNQEDFLKAVVGDAKYYKVCNSYFPCGTPFSSEKGMDGLLKSNFKKAQELLKEAGYDGTPIVLMHSTDLAVLTNLAPVAKSLMEKAGFKVDMQSMDWQTLVARRSKKDPPNAGGWHAFLTSWVVRRHHQPDLHGLHECRLRQGHVRLAVRCGYGEAARRLRARDRSRQAEGHRRGDAGARGAGRHPYPARPVVSGRADAQERRRHGGGPGAGVLEHRHPVVA